MNGICAVGQFLCLSETIFIGSEIVVLGFFCVIITSCALEEYLKFCASFGSINACCTVIAVFYESDLSFLQHVFKFHVYSIVSAVICEFYILCFRHDIPRIRINLRNGVAYCIFSAEIINMKPLKFCNTIFIGNSSF